MKNFGTNNQGNNNTYWNKKKKYLLGFTYAIIPITLYYASIFYFRFHVVLPALTNLFASIFIPIFIYLTKDKLKYQIFANFLLATGFLVITINAVYLGGPTMSAYLWVPLIPLLASFVLNKYHSLAWMLVSVVFYSLTATKGEAYWSARRVISIDESYSYFVTDVIVFSIVICICGIIGDIIREGIEKEKDLAQQQIYQSAKLSSFGEIAGGVAHEVNNPLAIIISKLDILKMRSKELALSEQDNKNIKTIEETCFRIAGIIKSLQSISSPNQDRDISSVLIGSVIDDIVILTFEKMNNIKVNFSLIDNQNLKQSQVMANRPDLSHCLLAVFQNALDAISSDQVRIKNIKLTISPLDSKYLLLKISDSGLGIDKKNKERLFQPFFTTKAAGKGLGLSLSRASMQQQEGDLYFDDNASETTFVIKIPLAKV